MAVTTTVSDIIAAALAKSTKNRANIIATSATEMLEVVKRAMRGLYSVASEVNPTFFAKSAVVSFAAPGWARPSDAELVFRIEKDGTEVAVVPYDDTAAETGKPAVYALGQVYRPAGNALDPVAGDLVFFYSKIPASPANVDATIDSMWVEQFNELLILEVAMYLALKDGRMDEVAELKPMRDQWALLFIKFLEHETANLRRRFGQARQFNTQAISALISTLAGGAA